MPAQNPAATIVGMASTTPPSSRGPILGALTGLVLLGGLVAFTLGLNEADDGTSVAGATASGEARTTDGAIDMPEVLPGDLVSVTSAAMPTGLVDQLGGREVIVKSLVTGADGIADLYGGPAGLALYGRTDASALMTIAVSTTAPGLFLPDGLPPLTPEAAGVARAQQVLERVDGAVCNVGFKEAVPLGQPVDEAELPVSTICQLSDGGRTYQLSGNGVSEEEAVTALKALAAYVAGDDNAVPDAADLPPAPAPPAPPAPPVPGTGSGSGTGIAPSEGASSR